ncbi:MAG: alpha/beta fold hydrolase [Stygiobacter sp.]|jgi:pimeloyl-ACP methyl ester carboxylesterase|uniref:Alpha/beta fold hydrolase n=1 Tax=Stygiobacter electus TaxID=3032292 RepID=A0AAE3P2M7_9BACT|nr:alpha/beta fold hydrolase [Stygiobacter electus]MDF1612954.1 alpha/beta fold hydrolase [Stygiobacter electus]
MRLNINGLSVNTFGDPVNQSIIFIHGFPYDHTMWMKQINELQNKYFCVAYDVRGLGDSYIGDGQYVMEFFVDDLLFIINELSLNKPIVCGLSMGGYIALRAIEKNQNMFGGLILCDTKSEADDNEAKLKRAANINMINTEGMEAFAKMFVTNCFADESPTELEEIFTHTLKIAQHQNPTGVKGCILAIGSRTDTTGFLSEIKIPTLVLGGSFDKLTPPVQMRAMAEKIPNCEYAIVPRAGHMSPIENPENVNDLLKGFLKRNFNH